ncbi:hypothetical protein GCM10027169_16160 [Gordonia jinhuaensis]|uniref:YbaB/EbfC DNA-binding family protein n=1 Tax=Gordonia jinhuaensis TaxID=1517702 RepID=A0A916X0W9_9ACTN|nr:YbaB/EbfC family nucleoid-associated protein [Gordonia jinhuaensis]GGB48557.1 hypothetical protein GCM10011489_39610 [Gordonia jinhuaensis]
MSDPDFADLNAELVEIDATSKQLQFEIAQVRGRGRFSSGEVSVTVDARGRVQSLELSPQALHRGAAALAEGIMQCIREAERQADAASADIVGRLRRDPVFAQAMSALDAQRRSDSE